MKKVLASLLFLCSFCYATEWVQVYDKTFIDIESISYDNVNSVYFWTKTLRTSPKDKIDGKDFWYIKFRSVINCEYRTFKVDTGTAYNLQNQEMGTYIFDASPWSPIIPDSLSDITYKALCFKK